MYLSKAELRSVLASNTSAISSIVSALQSIVDRAEDPSTSIDDLKLIGEAEALTTAVSARAKLTTELRYRLHSRCQCETCQTDDSDDGYMGKHCSLEEPPYWCSEDEVPSDKPVYSTLPVEEAGYLDGYSTGFSDAVEPAEAVGYLQAMAENE